MRLQPHQHDHRQRRAGASAAFATCGSALGSGLLLVFALFSAHSLHLLSLSAPLTAAQRRSGPSRPPRRRGSRRSWTWPSISCGVACRTSSSSVIACRSSRKGRCRTWRSRRGAGLGPCRGARVGALALKKLNRHAPRERGVAALLRRHRAPRRERDVRVGPRRETRVAWKFRALRIYPIFVFGYVPPRPRSTTNCETRRNRRLIWS